MFSPLAFSEYMLQLRAFLDQGGPVLFSIMLMTALLWCLLLERVQYLWFACPRFQKTLVQQWRARADHHSWYADKIRRQLLSAARIKTENNIGAIRTVVMVAPLMGLLGTVTGMVDVFDVMAITGSSNARAMAGGVSKATIPTMAGMVVSLLGMLGILLLQRRAKSQSEALKRSLFAENSL